MITNSRFRETGIYELWKTEKVVRKDECESTFKTLKDALTFVSSPASSWHHPIIYRPHGCIMSRHSTCFFAKMPWQWIKSSTSRVRQWKCIITHWRLNVRLLFGPYFQPSLYGWKFLLQTNHQSLIYLSRAKHSNARYAMATFSTATHVPCRIHCGGKENNGASFFKLSHSSRGKQTHECSREHPCT